MNETILGKISSVKFGVIDDRFGLFVTLSGSCSVQASYHCWNPTTIIPNENHKWNEDDRSRKMTEICLKTSQLLNDAKVSTIDQLLNKPVEFIIENGLLKSWRILTEVL